MAKFKIGDKVVIKDGSNIKGYVGGWYMNEYVDEIGEIVKIMNAPNDMTGYKVKLDCTDKMFIYDERGLEKMNKTRIELSREYETLTEGLKLVIEALEKIENGLCDYELHSTEYPTIPTSMNDTLDCPSWYIFNAMCDTKKALKMLEKEGQENE